MSPSRADLIHAAQALCNDFAAMKDIDTILTHFSSTHECTAFEHGEPRLVPFLGRSFVGTSAVREYFALLQKHLKYEDMSFSEYFADTNISKVCTKGKARFTWQSTGQAWDEVFVYVLDFDHECKVTNYQVWADTGAAYLASVGQLDGLKATEE